MKIKKILFYITAIFAIFLLSFTTLSSNTHQIFHKSHRLNNTKELKSSRLSFIEPRPPFIATEFVTLLTSLGLVFLVSVTKLAITKGIPKLAKKLIKKLLGKTFKEFILEMKEKIAHKMIHLITKPFLKNTLEKLFGETLDAADLHEELAEFMLLRKRQLLIRNVANKIVKNSHPVSKKLQLAAKLEQTFAFTLAQELILRELLEHREEVATEIAEVTGYYLAEKIAEELGQHTSFQLSPHDIEDFQHQLATIFIFSVEALYTYAHVKEDVKEILKPKFTGGTEHTGFRGSVYKTLKEIKEKSNKVFEKLTEPVVKKIQQKIQPYAQKLIEEAFQTTLGKRIQEVLDKHAQNPVKQAIKQDLATQIDDDVDFETIAKSTKKQIKQMVLRVRKRTKRSRKRSRRRQKKPIYY